MKRKAIEERCEGIIPRQTSVQGLGSANRLHSRYIRNSIRSSAAILIGIPTPAPIATVFLSFLPLPPLFSAAEFVLIVMVIGALPTRLAGKRVILVEALEALFGFTLVEFAASGSLQCIPSSSKRADIIACFVRLRSFLPAPPPDPNAVVS